MATKIANKKSDSDNDEEEYSSETELADNEMQSSSEEDEAMEEDEVDASTQPGSSKPRTTSESSGVSKPEKKKKRGIIYVSSIPKYMNVTILREMLGHYAKINRIYLQPGKQAGNYDWLNQLKYSRFILGHFWFADDDGKKDNKKKKRRRVARHFTEGWVEFESKRAAKQIAVKLNNSPIATRKSSKFYDILWSIKYLPRFKWVHLSERLTYEKAVHRHKLQTEIAQARKEAAFFEDNLDKSERNKKLKKKGSKTKNVATWNASRPIRCDDEYVHYRKSMPLHTVCNLVTQIPLWNLHSRQKKCIINEFILR